jgi:hypothetical protein
VNAICQRCGARKNDWTINQAEFNILELRHWKVQLCDPCAVQIQMVLSAALAPPLTNPAVDPASELAERDPTTRD